MKQIQKLAFGSAVVALVLSIMTSAFAGADEEQETYNLPLEAPVVLEKDSKLKKELLDLLRAKEGADLRFEGQMKCFGRWARFGGDAFQKSGEPLSEGDVAALWLYTSYGWVLVDALMDITDAGHLDSWTKDFGVPRKLIDP